MHGSILTKVKDEITWFNFFVVVLLNHDLTFEICKHDGIHFTKLMRIHSLEYLIFDDCFTLQQTKEQRQSFRKRITTKREIKDIE